MTAKRHRVGKGKRAPTMHYDRWQYLLKDPSGTKVIDFGTTHDAWRAGMTPEEFVAQAPLSQGVRARLAFTDPRRNERREFTQAELRRVVEDTGREFAKEDEEYARDPEAWRRKHGKSGGRR
jgi:hypothetical protein